MPLHYQDWIDKLNLTECPFDVSPVEKELEAFRFSYAPIEHANNFLPNVVFDEIVKNPFNYDEADDKRKCLRCGASFYVSLEKAVNAWGKLNLQIREMLGYTHIAKGKLYTEDGFVSVPQTSGHFTFYENEARRLKEQFKLEKAL